jgi:hypothetical protein
MSQIIELSGKMFYNTEIVKHSCPAFFYGCAKTLRKIIEKKKLTNEEYTYATFAPKTNKWSLSNDSVKSAKLLLDKTWVETNVPGFGNNNVKLDLENAPSIIEIKDEEKFKDNNGNIVEIETRGTKNFDSIYFYGKDVEKMLNINDISTILNNSNSSYEIIKHYKKFYRPTLIGDECKTVESNNPERIYLTYFGLIKMLITTKNSIAESFQKWALKTLFTVQMGSLEDKKILSSKLLGCDINSVKTFLNSGVQEYSVLYLICIGKVKDLSLQIEGLNNKNPEEFVFKYGYTSDLNQRLQSHKQTFGKLKNTNISLVLHIPIDEKYLSESEVELKQTFKNFDYIIENSIHKELVVFNENKLSLFKKFFKSICEKYSGNCKKLQEELEKQQIRHEYELKEYELKLKHEQELKNIEKQSKEEFTQILMNLSRNFNNKL